jgi:hypothetical protein
MAVSVSEHVPNLPPPSRKKARAKIRAARTASLPVLSIEEHQARLAEIVCAAQEVQQKPDVTVAQLTRYIHAFNLPLTITVGIPDP